MGVSRRLEEWVCGASAPRLRDSPPTAYRTSVEAVSVLTAASTVAIQAGVASSAAPAITLVVGQTGTVDRRPHLAAVGMLTAATVPLLAQICHWGRGESGGARCLEWVQGFPPANPGLLLTCAHTAIPFVAQTALTAVAHTAHGLGCTGRGTHRLQLCPQDAAHVTGSVAVLLATASPTHPCAARAWSWGACMCRRGTS